MANEYKTISVKINGKQSISIPVEFRKNGKVISDDLIISLKGFLKFEGAETQMETEETVESSIGATDKTVIYPVLFSTDKITVSSGRFIFTLLPRSEDIFEVTSSLAERASIVISNSQIINSPDILSDEQINDDKKDPVAIKVKAGVPRTPYKISVEITVYNSDGTLYAKTIDRGVSPQVEDSTSVSSIFKKTRKRTPSNLIIDCYNDEEWIPTISPLLNNNNGTLEDIDNELEKLSYSTPFGASTMYDAIISASNTLSDNGVNSIRKVIYNFTDNETVGSMANVEDVINEVNNIDGYKKVPVLNANMSIVSPETLSVRANSTDTKDLNKLSFNTGGQSVTVTSEDYLDDVVGIFYSESVGSLGYGTYEFVVDLGKESAVNYISALFDIPHTNANATWSIETSLDNFSFTKINKQYGYSEAIELDSINARYIRFKVLLITGFSSSVDEYSVLESPSLRQITIIHNISKVRYLYLNSVEVDNQPYHMAIGVDASNTNDNQIEVGLAKSNSAMWDDFANGSQPTVKQNGKIVVPIRFSQDITRFDQEPLHKIDHCILRTEYGSWDSFSYVYIYDDNGNVVPSTKYTLSPREGLVILDYALPLNYVDGSYKIGILNSDKFKIGMKLTNSTTDTPLEIFGIGYLYSTGKNLLSPLSKANPEARNVIISPDGPDKFTKIELSYDFYDYNFESEDKSKRKITWYINGSPISYLEDMSSWNDINNSDDPLYMNTPLHYPDTEEMGGDTLETWLKKQSISIFSTGDSIYCEIQVTDGELYSEKVKSNTLVAIESPPILSTFTIRGKRRDTGEIISYVAPGYDAVIYPEISEIFYGDGDYSNTEITWYCNDEVFKTGIYGAERASDNTVPYEIHVNEVGRLNYVDIGLRINNSISVDITPRTNSSVGTTISSPTVIVQNTKPYIGDDYDFVGGYFGSDANLVLGWAFYDFEIMALLGQDETGQKDQTMIKWYRKNAGDNNEFEHVYTYNDHSDSPITKEKFIETSYNGKITTSLGTNRSYSTVSSTILHAGQQWYAEITPHDSLDAGEMVTTKTITIAVSS